MNVDAYLNRIGLETPITPDLETLEAIQRAHLTAVPFENLDVFARRGVRTDDVWTFDKVVNGQRGGWCFTLNGSLAVLLTRLGYDVTRHAAIVAGSKTTDMATHLTLSVLLDRPYLVDVGFGDSFIRPLPLDEPGPHDGGIGAFWFRFEDDRTTTLVRADDSGSPQDEYTFDMTPRQPVDFEAASHALQTRPGLQWTKSRFATRLLNGGPDRVTLLEDRLRFRSDGVWSEEAVSPDAWDDLLEKWFGLTP